MLVDCLGETFIAPARGRSTLRPYPEIVHGQ